MILIDEYFKNYPARKRVAEFLLKNGISVRNGSLYIGNVEVSPSAVARALGVNRKVVYFTVETIESSGALRLLFERLKPGLSVEEVAPAMGWETLEIEVNGSPAAVLESVLKGVAAEGNDVVSVNLRNLPGEDVYLSIVVERPLRGETLRKIGGAPGVRRILVRTPERDKTKLVCTFCEVRYCPRRLEGGGNVEG
ncbi:regulator of amino acid metabolism, contains ACT domain protein [Thermococcus sp.]|uniref:regulator of amino acid metabolism, contains ACT domain protein n=1 Tax=Thermococcus sp. TaxID=35749 RepID=UPI00262213F1|nr:regulator of amino acid metabolism, contains ACT domain protein [Thermococcus sp.]